MIGKGVYMKVFSFFLGCVAGFSLFWGITTDYFFTGGLIFLILAGLLGFIIYDSKNNN